MVSGNAQVMIVSMDIANSYWIMYTRSSIFFFSSTRFTLIRLPLNRMWMPSLQFRFNHKMWMAKWFYSNRIIYPAYRGKQGFSKLHKKFNGIKLSSYVLLFRTNLIWLEYRFGQIKNVISWSDTAYSTPPPYALDRHWYFTRLYNITSRMVTSCHAEWVRVQLY